jgi:hypothetical protein
MPANNRRNQDDLGSNSAGQSGDIQQISDVAGADSESVAELMRKGRHSKLMPSTVWKTPKIQTCLR